MLSHRLLCIRYVKRPTKLEFLHFSRFWKSRDFYSSNDFKNSSFRKSRVFVNLEFFFRQTTCFEQHILSANSPIYGFWSTHSLKEYQIIKYCRSSTEVRTKVKCRMANLIYIYCKTLIRSWRENFCNEMEFGKMTSRTFQMKSNGE